METIELAACVDCYMFLHGIPAEDRGEDYPEETLKAIERIAADNGGARIDAGGVACDYPDDHVDGDCDCGEYGFSWSRCEVCLSSLGGDRYGVTLILTPKE